MKERIVDEQIRLVPYYRNDAVSLRWYQDAAVCKQIDNRDTPYALALLHRMHHLFMCSPNFYSHSGGVRTTFMAPNIFLLLRFFFILSFYISLSPNHYFVISNDSFPLSGLLCGKCKYFRLTNVKKSVK